MLKIRVAYSVFCFLLCSSFAFGQLSPISWVGSTKYDFGQLIAKETVEHTFQFRNDSKETIQIIGVSSSCGCLIPTWDNKKIEPRQIGKINVQFVESKNGVYENTLMVYMKKNSPSSNNGKYTSNPNNFHETLLVRASIGAAFRQEDVASMNEPYNPQKNTSSIQNNQPIAPQEYNQTQVNQPLKNDELNTGKYAPFLSEREKEMIYEINKVRSNPSSYITFIDEYTDDLQRKLNAERNGQYKKMLMKEVNAARELRSELMKMKPVGVLKPNPSLQRVSQEHGDYIKTINQLTHTGKNNADIRERLTKANSKFVAGSENLVAGQKSIRASLIALLVDYNYPGRNHRKNILSSKWNYVSAHEIGDIPLINDVWIQNFAELAKSNNNGTVNKPTIPKPTVPVKPTPPVRNTATNTSTDKLNTANNETYLSAREKQMIREVNLLRSNPKGYIKYVEEYIRGLRESMETDARNKSQYKDEIKTANELIEELEVMGPLSILKPHHAVFEAANKHGNDLKGRGTLSHVGSDGSYPWDRILKEDKLFTDGNENLVGGPKEIRISVLLLLIDTGIETRGHRRTLLREDWEFIICYELGNVGGMPNCWIQKFAK